ncbi:MAG: hypothetical protein EXR73_12895, partial [Myxococcales bacterium]|nr:hypothetical protein [Myxococcales bacterium]
MASMSKVPVAVVAMLALASGVALAADSKAVSRVEQMNRSAMEDYDLLEFESAKKQLTKALGEVKASRLGEHRVAAMTHIHLGIVYAGGLEDDDSARLAFVSAIEIDGEIEVPKAYRSPAIDKLFIEAKKVVGEPEDRGGG